MTEPINTFDEMNLKEELLRGIYGYGFEAPSLIQSKAIPLVGTGKDLIAQSQSGTGKTGAFTISTLQKVDESVNTTQCIILAHTRELAQQIHGVSSALSTHTKIVNHLCIGGMDSTTFYDFAKPGIVIGTPGRVIDLVKRKRLPLDNIKLFVLDEADEMLSPSFQEQIKELIQDLPLDCQICLFSATMTPEMIDLTERFMDNPIKLLIENENLTLDGIKQFYVNVVNDQWKFETFCDLYNMISINQTIVYVNSIKRGINLKNELEKKLFTVSLLHSNMTPLERSDIMKEFRSGKTRILLSTDLLSRGIDIQQISVVVNYDIPKNMANYLHRIGRSGRFGRKGVAINLVSQFEKKTLGDIKWYYKTNIEEMPENIQEFI